GRKDQLQQAAAEIGPIDALTGIGEDQLLDHVADVIIVACGGGAPTTVEMEWEINVHHVPLTRVCVEIMFKPVPVGLQVAWLFFSSTAVPLALTRVAALVHVAVTHGPPDCVGNVQPEME